MTPEEAEMRKRLGIKDEDIYYIPTGPLWELCRQFKEALPGQSEVGDAVYGFYCQRVKEIAKQRAKVKRHDTNGRQKFNTEAALMSFTPGLK